MKRGFLLRAEAKKAASKRKDAQKKTTPASPKAVEQLEEQFKDISLGQQRSLPIKLASGNLTEAEKALPSDYNRNVNRLVPIESDPRAVNFGQNVRLVTTIPQPVPDGETECEWVVNGPTKAKVLNAPGYPALIPKPHRPDLYQIGSTPDMGQGLFAKHDIKRGELIFAERPLIVAPHGMQPLSQGPIPAHYTERQISQILMYEFETVLKQAFDRLSPENQADLKALHNAHTGDGSGPLLGIMRSNTYAIESLYDGSNKVAKYGGICKIASRINHSCMPNVHYYFKINSFSMQFYALRDIKAGDQLFCSYCLEDGNLAQRQAELAPYGFVCKCPACVNATPESDKLRNTFETQIINLTSMVTSPSGINKTAIGNALKLETDMVKEGLDSGFRFVALLTAIGMAYAKTGELEECEKYTARAEAFQSCIKGDE